MKIWQTNGNMLVGKNDKKNPLKNSYTKNDTFTATDLGNLYKDDTNNINNGYPILFWE